RSLTERTTRRLSLSDSLPRTRSSNWRTATTIPLQRPLHLDLLVTLQHVAFLDVVVPDDLHAAFHAGTDLAGVVLVPLELLQAPAVLDDHVVASDANKRVALHHAVGDIAPGDGADLRDLEDLADLRVPQHLLPKLGRQHPLRRLA